MREVLPFSGIKICPNFQRTGASTVEEDVFNFVRSGKMVAEVLGLTMVV
jgi:hypothetical protein